MSIAPIDLPILVMGRDSDHLQGIFRVSYELLGEGDAGEALREIAKGAEMELFVVRDGRVIEPTR